MGGGVGSRCFVGRLVKGKERECLSHQLVVALKDTAASLANRSRLA